MRLGIISDTHDHRKRTRLALELLQNAGAEALVHCGDITTPEILLACAVLPCWFVLGNNDSDTEENLRQAAADAGIICLDQRGFFPWAGKRIAITHGHRHDDIRYLLRQEPDILLSGHSHIPRDEMVGKVRWINPGALHRAKAYTVAVLDLTTDDLEWLELPKNK